MSSPADQLNINDVLYQLGKTYFERGQKYLSRNHVLDETVTHHDPSYSEINGIVTGAGGAIYYQDIHLTPAKGSGIHIEGNCSCPVGFNCKHVAAVCLDLISKRQHSFLKQQSSYVPESDPLTAHQTWLQKLSEAGDPESFQQEKWIIYILENALVPGELSLTPKATQFNKNGQVGRGRKVELSWLRLSAVSQGQALPVDVDIGDQLHAMNHINHEWKNTVRIKGAMGHSLLNAVLATGRCYWQSPQTPALRLGEQRSLNVTWDRDEAGDHIPSLHISPQGIAVLTQPLLYLDLEAGQIGPLHSPGFNTAQVRLLMKAPALPENLSDKFSNHLVSQHPELALTPPSQIDITELRDIPPIPVLTLHNKGQVSLYFSYDDHPVPPYNTQALYSLTTDQGMVRIHRNLDQEIDAISQLRDAWFEPSSTDFRPHSLTFTDQQTLEGRNNSGIWFELLENTLPKLEQQGWRILHDDDYALRIDEPDDWINQIDQQGPDNDWFEFRFDITIDGHRLPLLPIIAELIQEQDIRNPPEYLVLEIGDQHYLKIPTQRIKPVIDTLYELFEQQTPNAAGALELSRFDAPRLNDLAEQTDTGWKGADELRAFGKKLKDFTGIEAATPPKGLQGELRPYQQEGLNWLQFLREYELGGVLADDMGLGKTLQTLAHLQLEKEAGRLTHPALIVAPTSLMGNWRREAERFTPDLKVLVLQGHERKQHFKKIKQHDLVLTTYPLLPRDGKILAKQRYHSLILDEAQIIKNPKSKAAQLVRKIKAQHRLCLTGTPMENHLGELWALFDFLMPRFLGNQKTFNQVYRNPIEKQGDQDRRQALAQRIRPFMLRRNKNEVATELPAKTEILRSVPLGDQQATLYESIRLSMEKKVRDSIASKGLGRSHITILDALLKLRQTCCDPRLLSLQQAKKVKESAKLDMLMEMIPEQLEEGRRILLFSQFTKMLGLIEAELKKRGIKYTKLTGQTRKRDDAIEAFTSGKVPLFLISLKAGGVGLNLTEADTVIHYDPWWNPAAENQATDRAHRIGQDKPVFVYKLITENSVEEKILAMQNKKQALAEGIYQQNKQADEPKLSADDLKDLFTPIG